MGFRDLRRRLGSSWSDAPGLWDSLGAPGERDWFHACRAWIQCPEDGCLAERAAALGIVRHLTDIRSVAFLHLGIAHLVRRPPASPAVRERRLRSWADRYRLPVGAVRDLEEELRTRQLPEAKAQVVIPLLLVGTGNSEGKVADLTVALVARDGLSSEDGSQVATEAEVYPVPAQLFLRRHAAFEEALQAALSWVRSRLPKARGWDFRWSLHERLQGGSRGLVDRHLEGPSAGAAFALAMARLLTQTSPVSEVSGQRSLAELDLNGVAVTATVDAEGNLGPIGGEAAKLTAAMLSFPKIHTVIVAKHQEIDIAGLIPDTLRPEILRDPGSDLHVVRSGTLPDAIDLLAAYFKTRWQIDCGLPERDPDFVGRRELMTKLADYIDRTESGFLFLVGGMGRGKSAFLAEFVRRETERRGERQVLHVIDYQRPDSATLDGITTCLYGQLRRKHRFPEPAEWSNTSASLKLSRLLEQVSAQPAGSDRKEVLFLDAVDQTRMQGDETLIPGALGRLPRGVLCVITSRGALPPTLPSEQVKEWPWDEIIRDCTDIRKYLEAHSARLDTPLRPELIDDVVKEGNHPVFLTVKKLLRKLQDPAVPPDEKAKLIEDPALWLAPPEDLVREEAWRIVAEAKRLGIDEDVFWRALGLISLAREPVSERHLRALGLWDKIMSRVLELARNFFKPRPRLRSPETPFVFDHPGYFREVASRLTPEETRSCHRDFAAGCRKWRNLDVPAREYALRHRLAHLILARHWEDMAEAFGEADFVVERARLAGFAGIYEDVLSALRDAALPEDWRSDLEEWERFVGLRIGQLNEPAALGSEIMNEYLPQARGPFARKLGKGIRRSLGLSRIWLRKTTGPRAGLYLGHSGNVTSICFSPDGGRIASASWAGEIKVWDARTLDLLGNCEEGHGDCVGVVRFSPDGKWLVSASEDCTVKVWDSTSGVLKHTCRGHTGPVRSVCFSPDGTLCVSGSRDKTVKIWETATGTVVADCQGTDEILGVRFSPRGDRIGSWDYGGTVCIWNAQDGRLAAAFRAHSFWVGSVGFSPDGETIVSGGAETGQRPFSVKIWNAKNGTLLATCKGHTYCIPSVCFSPDGSRVGSGSWDSTVRVFDVRTGGCTFVGRKHASRVFSVGFSPDGKLLISAAEDHTVRVWNVCNGNLISSCIGHTGGVTEVCLSPDGRRIASAGGSDLSVRLWDTYSGRLLAIREGFLADANYVGYSPDRRRAASCQMVAGIGMGVIRPPITRVGGVVRIWDTETGRLLNEWPGERTEMISPYSPEGGRIIADGDICDSQTGKALLTAPRHHRPMLARPCWSPDGKRVAFVVSGEHGRDLVIGQTETGALVYGSGKKPLVGPVCFSPCGRRIAVGTYSNVEIFDSVTGELLLIAGHTEPSHPWTGALSFSPSGRWLAAGGADGAVGFWDSTTGATLGSSGSHTGRVGSLCFSPDGRYVATASRDRTVKIWEAPTAVCLLTLYYSTPLACCAWSGTGTVKLHVADCIPRFFAYELVESGSGPRRCLRLFVATARMLLRPLRP